jgi:hypothetical protein
LDDAGREVGALCFVRLRHPTGIAAVLAVIIANLQSILEVVSDGHLKTAVSLLVGSVFLASAAYLLSSALKVRNEVANELERILGSPGVKTVLSQIQMDPAAMRAEMCKPFFGPLGWIMKRAAQKGALDPFNMEKGSIRLIVWQAYTMWLSMILAVVALAALVFGIR